MGLLASFRKLLKPSTPVQPQAARVLDIAALIDNSTRDVQPVVVTGCAGSGKTTFVRAAARHFTDCVVHLHRSSGAVAGFEEAPLMGQWLPQGQSIVQDADLEDVLRMRPEGLFTLEMPAQSETAIDLNDLLNDTLMSGVLHWEASRGHGGLRTLTLILEDGLGWLPENVLIRLFERSRPWQLRVMLVESRIDTPAVWDNMGHLVAFKSCSTQDAQRQSEFLGEPVDRLRGLTIGFGLYRSVHWQSAQLAAQLFSVSKLS